MTRPTNTLIGIAVLVTTAWITVAQTPNRAAIAGSKEDEDAVERGGALFAKDCGSCHGPAARGTGMVQDLIRSVLVRDDEKGDLIGPVLRTGRPDKGMPRPVLTESQIADLVAWLHVQVYAAANRGTYEFLNILTGDARKGEQYFNGAGQCNKCHSPTGDLARIGDKYDPPVLQSAWLTPRRGRGTGSRSARTATVTPHGGQPITGLLQYVDEFNVVLRDSAGNYRSFAINNDEPRVEINDPLQAHYDLYRKLTDADMHNVTAYLATLK